MMRRRLLDHERWKAALPTKTATAGEAFDGRGVSHTITARPAYQTGGVEVGYLLRRAKGENTCGYISGNPMFPFSCAETQRCIYKDNAKYSLLGCCDDTTTDPDLCFIWTTCVDSSTRNLFTTNDGWTLMCDQSASPFCITHKYIGSLYSGYSFLACGAASGTNLVYFGTTGSASSSSSSSSSTPASTTSSSSSTSSTTSSSTSSAASTSSTAPSPVPSTDDEPLPVGAIVGGVVGGLAAIALILFAVWLILHQRHKNKAQHQQVPPPPSSQGFYYPNSPTTGGYDARGSIAKPSEGYHHGTGSPVSAASPTQMGGSEMSATPMPQQQQQQQMYSPPAQQQYGGYQNVGELPTERGHGEMRELGV
ncbi:hypothetical protein QBC35DRAFT_469239 [Podospora australis]|uniref:Mid2 domain-containing protein n=1 Tax=Podospora australis TaxID=1536484 RepID=A0AAN6X692_9PEZI|nr:hypothetical protein QBC35DRAFT_469239 [Podospora australis]